MTNIIFTRDIHDSISTIAYELRRMNELKEKELKLQQTFYEKQYGIKIKEEE